MTSKALFQNTFTLRRSRMISFVDMINITSVFIKATLKDSKKVKKNEKLFIKMQSISIFLDITKVAGFL